MYVYDVSMCMSICYLFIQMLQLEVVGGAKKDEGLGQLRSPLKSLFMVPIPPDLKTAQDPRVGGQSHQQGAAMSDFSDLSSDCAVDSKWFVETQNNLTTPASR